MRKASRFVGLAMIVGMAVALTAPIGTSPAGATPAPAWTAYVVSQFGPIATPINLATNTAGTPIKVGPTPTSIAITPNGAFAFVTDAGDNTVTIVNTATNTSSTAAMVGANPAAVAISPNGPGPIYGVYVANTGSNTVSTSTSATPITVGPNPDGIAITPNGATAYVTNAGTNTVTPIDTASNTTGPPITVGLRPSSIAITPNGATAYVSHELSNTVTPIDTATNTAGPPITVAGPGYIAIAPNGATAYVTSATGVTPIDTATNTPGPSIVVAGNLTGIAITPDGATAYVTDYGSHTVTPIDLATNTAGTPITVGSEPVAIAITPDQAPVAHLSVTPAGPGHATSFDASASTVAFGTISTYAWAFGDGSTATTSTPTTTHSYAAPGSYTVTVTETDSAGTSTTKVFTGQTMSRNGGPSAVASQSFALPLTITTSSLPGGSVWSRTNKVKYSATLAATGGNPPYKWSLASGSSPLPPGLKLKRSTGVISGRATTAGTYSFTAQVVDTKMGKPKTQNTATATLSITIS